MSTHLHLEDNKGGEMLTKLLPEQVSKFWPVIKYSIEQALPPLVEEHPDKMNRLLSSALVGDLDVWASYVKEEGGNRFEAIVTTRFLYDNSSDTKSMLLYTIFAYDKTSSQSWMEGYETLKKYALANKCKRLIAYSASEAVINIAKAFGADTEYTFISLPFSSFKN